MAYRKSKRLTKRPPKPRPVVYRWWHKMIAAVVLAGFVAASVLILLGSDDRRASWAVHTAFAVLVLVVGIVFCGIVLSRRVTGAVLRATGWTVGAAFVWMGLEYWADWRFFYSSSGKAKITTPGAARFYGTAIALFGVGLLWEYVREAFGSPVRRRRR